MTQTTVAGMPSASFIAGLNVTLQLVAMCAEAHRWLPAFTSFYRASPVMKTIVLRIQTRLVYF